MEAKARIQKAVEQYIALDDDGVFTVEEIMGMLESGTASKLLKMSIAELLES